jgi:poly(A) polymerase
MKLKLILEEIQHDTALKLISDLIKNSQWKNKVFLAGGAVRDELMGMGIKDLDLTVAAPNGGIEFAEWLAKKLKIYRQNSNPVIYPRFGTAKITLKGVKYNGIDLSSIDIECVMTRKEKYEYGNRKPEVDYGTPQQDVERRDLTINSLLKDLTSGEILDLTGKGMKDLQNKIIRTPLDPDIIFKEDPLRMLRAIRFTVKYNWKLPFSMIKALKTNAKMLSTISSERIQDELNKILLTNNPDKGIKLLQMTGLNKYVAPELDRLVKLKQNDYHMWDANKHTLMVLKNTPKSLITRLAALFHDAGKSYTKSVVDNEIHFYEHEDISAEIAKDIMTKLKYPTNIINAVYTAVKNHMRTKSFGKDAELVSDKALRKLQNDLGDHLETTLDLIHADNISHGKDDWKYNMPNQVPSIRNRMKNLGGDFTKKLQLPLDGGEIIKMFNLKPGPIVGKLKKELEDEFLNNPKMDKKEAIKFITNIYNKKYK